MSIERIEKESGVSPQNIRCFTPCEGQFQGFKKGENDSHSDVELSRVPRGCPNVGGEILQIDESRALTAGPCVPGADVCMQETSDPMSIDIYEHHLRLYPPCPWP